MNSLHKLPKPLLFIAGQLAKTVSTKFPDPKLSIEVVSGLVFGKVICPIIVSPEKFDLVKPGTVPALASVIGVTRMCRCHHPGGPEELAFGVKDLTEPVGWQVLPRGVHGEGAAVAFPAFLLTVCQLNDFIRLHGSAFTPFFEALVKGGPEPEPPVSDKMDEDAIAFVVCTYLCDRSIYSILSSELLRITETPFDFAIMLHTDHRAIKQSGASRREAAPQHG